MSLIAWSVCVFSIWVSCAKMAEPIKMPFGRQNHVNPRNHIFDGDPDSPRKGALLYHDCIPHCLPAPASTILFSVCSRKLLNQCTPTNTNVFQTLKLYKFNCSANISLSTEARISLHWFTEVPRRRRGRRRFVTAFAFIH